MGHRVGVQPLVPQLTEPLGSLNLVVLSYGSDFAYGWSKGQGSVCSVPFSPQLPTTSSPQKVGKESPSLCQAIPECGPEWE